MNNPELKAYLSRIADELIDEVVRTEQSIREGVVMARGPAPYRRLDCDGRALAYIRTRPKKRAVRVDVSGLWRAPGVSRLRQPNAGGVATLMLRSETDKTDAARFLLKTVAKTRGPEKK